MILNKVASKLRSRRALGRSVRDNDNDDDDDEQIMVSQEGPWPFGQTPEVSRTDFTDLPTFRFIFLGSRNFSQILLLFVSNSIFKCCSFDIFTSQVSAFLEPNRFFGGTL